MTKKRGRLSWADPGGVTPPKNVRLLARGERAINSNDLVLGELNSEGRPAKSETEVAYYVIADEIAQ